VIIWRFRCESRTEGENKVLVTKQSRGNKSALSSLPAQKTASQLKHYQSTPVGATPMKFKVRRYILQLVIFNTAVARLHGDEEGEGVESTILHMTCISVIKYNNLFSSISVSVHDI